MGWMSNWLYANNVPTSTWRSAMTMARELSLKKTAKGIRLVSQPVTEISSIQGESVDIPSQSVNGELDLTKSVSFPVATSQLQLTWEEVNSPTDFGISLSNAQGQALLIGYDAGSRLYYIDRSGSGKSDFYQKFAGKQTAPRLSTSPSVKLRVLLDVASVELFADDGEVVMTSIFFPDTPFNKLALYTKGGQVQLTGGKLTNLKSIWGRKPAMAEKR
jgi:sucrose-6-phosphate hydrolase SacC (GH32 family)